MGSRNAMTVEIKKVSINDITHFRVMAEAYWRELMPKSIVIQDIKRREAYFEQEFTWDGGSNHPHWAIVENSHVGFMTFEVSKEQKIATVNNLYVIPDRRRQGCGTAMVQWLFSRLDRLRIEQIDLNVRRDNPRGLAFWQAQCFGIAAHRLRHYRNPVAGKAYEGALSSDFS